MTALRFPICCSTRLSMIHAPNTSRFLHQAPTFFVPKPRSRDIAPCRKRTPILRCRTFFTDFLRTSSSPISPSPTTLSITRNISFPSSAIYPIIADISSYSAFLPFCTSSTVTSWSAPHPRTGKLYPEEATLTIGWQGIEELFVSRVYCVPDKAVEALSGDAETELAAEDLEHHYKGSEKRSCASGSVFQRMRTSWKVEDAGQGRCEVQLEMEYVFTNMLYQRLGGTVQARVAEYMIEAFETRVKEILGKPRRI
ncbi:hypothetical protein EJ05DRAFT_480686 [Pseudovirgaria hyperparasitica]|uniref:Coenzyme Q-binding protein COQ10 START domain-containing protein n=1 Tax=Pseudovirgaria hyperparasitica TaxID=470096 RepID=A0A6A6VR61_9PEZI|nr:uncharacterized protein EJ05DRAFT_480686 [Pseudovirgaria hyperparasitica]KAF2753082.1 hypothetical protein EJ05DRAFT_480686 [Pseudovirgaria hyperparasitica]